MELTNDVFPMKSILLPLILLTSVFCAFINVEAADIVAPIGRQKQSAKLLTKKEVQANRKLVEILRQATAECEQVSVLKIQFYKKSESDTPVILPESQKAEICRILAQAEPLLHKADLYIHPGSKIVISFLDADGRKILTIDTLDIGTPDFYNQHTRILLPSKEKALLNSILRNF